LQGFVSEGDDNDDDDDECLTLTGSQRKAAARWRQRESATSAAAWRRRGGGGSAMAAAAGVEAVEDNLSAKAAGNDSVDGRMTACDDKIGRQTTTQQPTNERQIRTTTMATGTARWAAAQRDTTKTAMATGDGRR
jgi:hypothetical protein